jgi:patatin-related protein
MKEKELRLALVCYGGVSLAVYMHGVTKEILNLVRASRTYHSEEDTVRRQTAPYSELNRAQDRECDTEAIYFELLRAIGKSIELRVVVDAIAGASAGGINGVLLARAIAHDLSLDGHRQIWLEQADILALMDDEHLAGTWSKMFMRPFLWAMNDRWISRFAPDAEMRQKLSIFMRSRWFNPPFSGELFTNMLFDAFDKMGESIFPTASLIPLGHKLDLIVSVTDFYGYVQNIPLHDPETIREREHRHVLKFGYLRHTGAVVTTDFDAAHVPGLVFAARATSSFPGAFPPAQIGEIDKVLKARGGLWQTRAEFIANSFRPFATSGTNPEKSSFIDGSVLNNKPFAEAITAIRTHSAFREVDRRIVYIDPDPEGGHLEGGGAAPGFFQTIRGALSDIPRNQPVRDELESVHEFSERVRQYRQIVAATRPHVAKRVRNLLPAETFAVMNVATLSKWRRDANVQAAIEAGYAYDGYVQLKVGSVLGRLARFIEEATGEIQHPSDKLKINRAVESWARERDIFPVRWSGDDNDAPAETTPWVKLLREFDLSFRVRRLRFVIRRLNELYEEGGATSDDPFSVKSLDASKEMLYESLDLLSRRAAERLVDPEITQLCKNLMAGDAPTPEEIDALVGRAGPRLDLIGIDHAIDEAFSLIASNHLPHAIRADLMQAYIGFPFFDVLTFPLNKWSDLDDVDAVRIDRISPEDAKALREGGAQSMLLGRNMQHFAAFFSRRARENDYLWGRLHAADRLVDIVASSVPDEITASGIDLAALKARLFRAILLTERAFLGAVPDLIRDLEHEVDMRLAEHNTQA